MASVIKHPPFADTLKLLIGEGDKIMSRTLPVAIAGLAANYLWPAVFRVGSPAIPMGIALLAIGVPMWMTSVVQVLVCVPKGELITGGPFAIVRHPLYTSVGLLVLPGLGLLCGSWVGVAIGVALYLVSRRFVANEERDLATKFGRAYEQYRGRVLLPFL